jgi:RNA polymerase sigma-70 factor (ECF subfamily)
MRKAVNGEARSTSAGTPMDSGEELMVLIASSQKPLFAYIRTLIGPTPDVEDILQEVNLVLWRKSHEFDGRGQFLSWACHIAYLQVLAYFQKRRRERCVRFEEYVLADLASDTAAEVERIDDRLEALQSCLAKLSSSRRRMILLRYEEGGSVQKVAGELERPAGSVRLALHRVRQQLADCIERKLARGGDS